MSLSKFVKIGSISNLSDARYCAGMMVDILGFEILDQKSEHYVDAATFQELTEWVAGVSVAGECHNASHQEILEVIKNYQIQYVEVNQLDVLAQLHGQTDRLLIYKHVLNTENQLVELPHAIQQAEIYASIIIIDAEVGVPISNIDEVISQINTQAQLLRAYQLTVESVSSIPTYWNGIELKGSVEDKAGYKDYGIVMDILEQIEED